MANFYHSVRLDESLCKGCINCIKRCPTQAIRVRNGKAVITSEFCIDCGECIRICQHHAKLPTYDSVDIMKNFKHTVALPAPALYGQFNNLTDVRVVLTALKIMGFDDVYEVSGAAELVSEISRDYVMKHTEHWPIISTACPVIVRLIRVRFPNLITHMLPVLPPVEVAARLARKKAMEKTGLPSEDIGILFISPCPAKTTFAKAPLCTDKSQIDGVLAIKDIYPLLLGPMKQAALAPEDLSISGRIGIGWGSTGGEAGGLLSDSYLAADGMENVIRVLEDLEDEKFHDLQFIELNACSGGCVGGVLTVENPYIAQAKLKRLHKYEVVARSHLDATPVEKPFWKNRLEYEPVFKLGESLLENINKINLVEELCARFPGLDCGSCGAPTCKALAEDIVRGKASENDCIHILREYLKEIISPFSMLDKDLNQGQINEKEE
ncbi:MAG: 4Fe-4S dicluster domain-containing protein [Lachnospiraceae bacterium]|nr:4Fe-4S dicluster domain-containing protein [Lachnospiraceae bacterium]